MASGIALQDFVIYMEPCNLRLRRACPGETTTILLDDACPPDTSPSGLPRRDDDYSANDASSCGDAL